MFKPSNSPLRWRGPAKRVSLANKNILTLRVDCRFGYSVTTGKYTHIEKMYTTNVHNMNINFTIKL